MKIGVNNSLLVSRNLGETSKAISRALERLSTGKRVNSPSDGLADYRASLSLESQVRGLSQVNFGINRAMGMLQVADSAISSQLDIVQRMREIAVEGANGTLDVSSRKTLQSELQSLIEEFDRITKSTEFDGQKLIDGSFDLKKLSIGLSASETVDLEFDSTLSTDAFEKTIGTGTFEARVTREVYDDPNEVLAHDLDNDGNLDLVVTANGVGRELTVFMGNGDGSFSSAKTTELGTTADPQPYRFDIGDINGDGIADLVTADEEPQVSLFIGNGDGTFKAVATLDSLANAEQTKLGDLDGDGDLDIVAINTANDVSVFLNNGDGSFESRVDSLDAGSQSLDVELADLNNDGFLDIIHPDSGGSPGLIRLGNGDGSFASVMTTTPLGSGYDLDLADLNGDGILDAVSGDGGGGTISIALGNGDGSFNTRTTIAVDSPRSVGLGDFNGDGVVDIVTNNFNAYQSITVLIGNGDGSFKAATTYEAGTTSAGDQLTLADLDKDGVLDIISAEQDSNTISIFMGKSTSTAAVADINVEDEEAASDLISILDDTIASLVEDRADIGTLHSRLEQAQAGNLVQAESLGQAKSLIEDTDFALETAELVKQQVLQQAQVAVQSQANVQLQVVLGLLRF